MIAPPALKQMIQKAEKSSMKKVGLFGKPSPEFANIQGLGK